MRPHEILHSLIVFAALASPAGSAEPKKAAPAEVSAEERGFRDRGRALAAEIEDALARIDRSKNGRFQDGSGNIRGADRLPTRLEAATAQADLHEAREQLESLREEARRAGANAALMRELDEIEPPSRSDEGVADLEEEARDLTARAEEYRSRAEQHRAKLESCPDSDDDSPSGCRERLERLSEQERDVAKQYERLAEDLGRDSEL